MIKKLKIGNIQLDNNVILAPMAGITDSVFRKICKDEGAGLVVTEMVSTKGLYYKDKKTEILLNIIERNRPVSAQIFGSDPDTMSYVVDNMINKRDSIDIIDINMGCPAPKIVKNGDGSALMKNPKLAMDIVRKIKSVSSKPVTVKIRAGWDLENINAVEFSKYLEQGGADLIAVHGRYREQFYSGKSDNNIIKLVKEAVKIPVVGNGDIYLPDDAINMIKQTNCDGIMLARGVLGNPWLIGNVIKALSGNYDYHEPNPVSKVKMLKKHASMMNEIYPERLTVLEMRKHAGWYIKGLKNSSSIRNNINKIDSLNVLYEYLDKYVDELQNNI